jgi:outer membrane receptor protein involved in Fe transport
VKPPPANNPTLAGTYGNILPNSAAQYNGLLGGNPALLPETAITTSFGIGFTPSFIPNFRAQIDYYNIKIENVITNLGGNTIINECVNSDLYCADVHRDSLGSLWLSNDGYVIDPLRNVGALQQRGVDFDASYSVEIGKAGKLHFNFVGTYVDEYEVTPAESLPGSSYNCAGLYGSNCSAFTGGPAFHWRHTFRTTWQTPWDALDISAAWRYFSPVKLESLSANPNLAAPAGETIANGGISNTDAFIASRSYLDLTASLKVTDAVTLRLGVNNVLDKDPPVIGASNLSGLTGNGNTYPQVYDSLGRYLFATVTAQF